MPISGIVSRGTIGTMKEQLSELRNSLGLEGKTKDSAKSMRAKCSGPWGTLVEIQSHHLRHHGPLPEGFRDYFDPKVSLLLEGLKGIPKVLESS